MSPFILFTLLFLIVLYALAWHDKPAGQHVLDKLPSRQHPGAERERSQIKS
jgi:hypothetical protein